MQSQVARWGNSLGVRIPKSVAGEAGLKEGSRVDIAIKAGRIVISPARPHYALKELLHGMTPKAMRDAFDWGSDMGREAIEE